MAVLSLFESTSRDNRSGSTRGRSSDLSRLSRERRLAFYLGACRALGVDPEAQPFRFVRCNDGRLRLFDPSRAPQTLSAVTTTGGPAARIERELAAGSAAVAGGGGVSYEIDLATGDLRVRDVIRAANTPVPPMATVYTPRRRGGMRELAASRTAVRTAPAR
jgi:hypothetical protein